MIHVARFFRKEVRIMDKGQLPDFRSFIEPRFHLSHRASGVDDGRVDPDIPASTVFHGICFMGALGLPSLLQLCGCDAGRCSISECAIL